MIAASMVSTDDGRRTVGWGSLIFIASCLAWIAGAVLARNGALVTQNVERFVINLFGAYRYLFRKKADA